MSLIIAPRLHGKKTSLHTIHTVTWFEKSVIKERSVTNSCSRLEEINTNWKKNINLRKTFLTAGGRDKEYESELPWNGKYYMVAHHIVVQHKLNKHCVQCLLISPRFSKLLFSVLSTPRLSFLFFYVLLCTYSSSSVLTSPFLSFNTSPFMSLLVLLCPY